MIKVAYVGDLHFSGSNYLTVGSSLNKVVTKCIEKKVDRIFILGDIFDSANIASHRIPLGTIIKAFNTPILRAVDNGITVVLMVGNHDLSSSEYEHSLAYLKGVNDKIIIIDEPIVLPLGNKKIGILPWIKNSLIKTDDFSEGVVSYLDTTLGTFKAAGVDALIGHVELSNYNLNGYRMVGNKYSIPKQQLLDVSSNIFLGHYHKADDYYLGSLTHLTFNDVGNLHRFIIQDLDTMENESIDIESPEYKIIVVNSKEDIPTELGTYDRYRIDINENIDLDCVKHLLADNVEIKVIREDVNKEEVVLDEIVLDEVELFKKYAESKEYAEEDNKEIIKRIEILKRDM